MTYRLLASFAHPDDEAFGTGGSLARFAAEGVHVTLVCATRGEAGEIADPSFATPQTLGQVRENELRCAAETMGIANLIFLDYCDSGMAGTSVNADPLSYINAPAEEVISQLVRGIRAERPHVVITFEPNGGYGHPDHIAIHRHTVAAFHAAADPLQFPEHGAAWQASRLFYTAIPRSFFRAIRDRMVADGMDTSQIDGFDSGSAAWPDEAVHVVLDVSATLDQKWKALNCHRTQFGPGNLFRQLPEDTVRELMSREYYAMAWPPPEPGLHMDSLFEGLA